VIPPAKLLMLTDGKLSLAPRPLRGQNMPVDHLFRSLADIQRSRAIGVILSGGGTDGTLGFQAIKSEGGITFAQDEKTAKHDSMPRSAIADGHVDYVLPPERIAGELLRISRHPYANGELVAQPELEQTDLSHIMALLRARTDVDFSNYKRSTIRRRIQRRM